MENKVVLDVPATRASAVIGTLLYAAHGAGRLAVQAVKSGRADVARAHAVQAASAALFASALLVGGEQ